MHARIEKIATRNLGMGSPPPSRVQVVGPTVRDSEQVNAAASPALALKFPPWRSRLLLFVLLAWFAALVAARALPAGAA